MKFNNFKIRTKLLFGFSLVITILIVVGAISLNGIYKVNDLLTEATSNRMPSVQSLQTINEAQTAIKAYERTLLISDGIYKTPGFRETQYKKVNEIWQKIDSAWAVYLPLEQTNEEKNAWDAYVVSWDAWKKSSKDFFELSLQKDRLIQKKENKADLALIDSKLNKKSEENRPLFSQAEKDLAKVIEINFTISETLKNNAAKVVSSQNRLMIGFIIGGVLVAILIAFFISALISLPVKKIDDAAALIAEGNLEINLDIESKDEIGNLADSFRKLLKANKEIVDKAKLVSNGDLTVTLQMRCEKDELNQALSSMVQRLNEIVAQILESAQNVASASSQFSSTTIQIAQGANEQASSAEEVSSSVEEMNSTIQQNTENAVQTEIIAKNAATGINEVAAAAQKSLEATNKIAEKIKIINAIAEKTDILAINAAIEAARAGEHGKGFAVVAAEVRKLAETSQKAAIEINNLSATSLKVTEESGSLMMKIIPEIQKTATLIQEIAASSNEQASGSNQISQAIEQLSKVTQQNSAAAEEMSSTAEELASQAEALNEAIAFFNTGRSFVKKEYKSNRTFQKTATSLKNGIPVKAPINSDAELKDSEFQHY